MSVSFIPSKLHSVFQCHEYYSNDSLSQFPLRFYWAAVTDIAARQSISFWSVLFYISKTVEVGHKMTSWIVLFCSQPQRYLVCCRRGQMKKYIFTFKKLYSEIIRFNLLKWLKWMWTDSSLCNPLWQWTTYHIIKQNKTSDVIFGKHWSTFSSSLWHSID